MDFLGNVEEITSEGRIVVSASASPGMGDSVFDGRKRKIGKVVRIFGPVDGPYVSVVLEDGTAASGLIGSVVYTQGVKHHGKGKRRY